MLLSSSASHSASYSGDERGSDTFCPRGLVVTLKTFLSFQCCLKVTTSFNVLYGAVWVRGRQAVSTLGWWMEVEKHKVLKSTE